MNKKQDDKTLNLYPLDYPFETLVSRINSDIPKTILDPDFQRKYKWDKGGWERASKFIESCLMRIPLPSCYFAEDENGRHLVIDGVQRLTTIKRFFNDEFALEGLTVFKELEGKKFSELGKYKSELESTTIRCIVLRKENPKQLIREIFSRLNQGAVKVSDQEIRHALFPGSLDNLLVTLGKIPLIASFGSAENPKNPKNSRENEEQVLRFLAFSDDIDLKLYNDKLGPYLDVFMEKNSNLDNKKIEILTKKFESAIENCVSVFGDNVFTDSTRDRKKQGLVYYDLLMPTIGLLDKNIVISKAEKLKDAFEELCTSEEFRRTLSSGLQKKSSILKRRRLWSALMEKARNE
jgi:Protein of unknown function DUF262